MYRRILLAYDGSLEGAIALREGALLARSCGAEVVLLSVVPDTAGVRMAEGAQAGVIAQMIENYKAVLERGVSRLKDLGFRPTGRLEVGEPAPVIGAVAQEIKAELVIVSHHKQTMLSRWWSGSADAYLSEHIGCSLLISAYPISDEAFEAEIAKSAVAPAMEVAQPGG
jgi:nucleotide-binding universal stress UspA family protein